MSAASGLFALVLLASFAALLARDVNSRDAAASLLDAAVAAKALSMPSVFVLRLAAGVPPLADPQRGAPPSQSMAADALAVRAAMAEQSRRRLSQLLPPRRGLQAVATAASRPTTYGILDCGWPRPPPDTPCQRAPTATQQLPNRARRILRVHACCVLCREKQRYLFSGSLSRLYRTQAADVALTMC